MRWSSNAVARRSRSRASRRASFARRPRVRAGPISSIVSTESTNATLPSASLRCLPPSAPIGGSGHRSGTAAPSHLADRNLRSVEVAEAGDSGAVHVGRRTGEDETLRLARRIEIVDIGRAQPQLDAARGVLIGRRMEREPGLAGGELTPEGRLEARSQAER